MCEKPAAGCVDDVDAMIAARDGGDKLVAVAYQDIYDPATLELKSMLLDGVIGTIRRACVWACWPRVRDYWQRCDWAGRMRRQGRWVMDSPANNALAHQVNLMPFLLGNALWTSAQPAHVHGELYRAAAIENYDCAALRTTMTDGVELLALLTHTCSGQIGPIVTLEGDGGTVHGDPDRFIIESPQASKSIAAIGDPEAHADELCTLEIARVQSVIVSAASQACPIRDVAESHIVTTQTEYGPVRAIAGIESVFEQCAGDFSLPHEAGVAWARPGAAMATGGYNHFAGPAVVGSAGESDQ
jgi:predicted dehydrogenase